MPINWTKHKEEADIEIGSEEFSGGMNTSSSPEGLVNQVPIIHNMYYEPSSGRLRTRWPFKRYSDTVVAGTSPLITGITYFNNKGYITSLDGATHTLHSMSAKTPSASLGTLNGVGYPSFQLFGSELCIATGVPGGTSVAEEMTTAEVLTDINAAPDNAIKLLEQDGQLALVGGTTYPDTYFESEVNNKDIWSGGTSTQISCGYLEDNITIHGMCHAAYNHIILFKKGRSWKQMWLINPTDNDPYAKLITEDIAPHVHRCYARAAGNLWIMDKVQGAMMLKGVDAMEKIVVDPESLEIGQRILRGFNVTDDAWMCVYPPHSQIWFCPDPGTSRIIFVLNYRNGTWVRFLPGGSLAFYCAYFYPNDGYLYLGANDGFVYRYTTDASTSYTDQTGTNTFQSYPQGIRSKIYDLFPYHYHEIKSPIINMRSIAAGNAIFRIKDDYSQKVALQNKFDFTGFGSTLYDYRGKTLYGAVNKTLHTSEVITHWVQQNCNADNFQYELLVKNGAIEFHSINSQIAKAREI